MLMYGITLRFYSDSDAPDLLRIGYIPNINPSYHASVIPAKHAGKFRLLSSTRSGNFKLLTIGDSFAEQNGFGFKSILSESRSILHVDRFISTNQIQTLFSLANSDFFDSVKVEYVLLEHVERNLLRNAGAINANRQLSMANIDSIVQAREKPKTNHNYKFFDRTTVTFPLWHFPKFFLAKNYVANGQVYNMELKNDKLFSNESTKLLFYYHDYTSITKNNDHYNVYELNNVLNAVTRKLQLRGIKLIVLLAPDKYDLYYEYILNPKGMAKPIFFDLMKGMKKDYIYIDGKALLMPNMGVKRDVYFQDDSHWSPIAAQIIAAEINAVLDKTEASGRQ